MLPTIPSGVPDLVENRRIDPQLELPADVAVKSAVRVELTFAALAHSTAACPIWGTVCRKRTFGLASGRSESNKMRYRKGSLNLNNLQDKAVLNFVADSRYVTHAQLFTFAQLDYYEYNRPSFNWRIRRMVERGLMRKQALPMLNGDALYSITRAGLQALESLGVYYLGSTCDREQDAYKYQMLHALEVNNIRLALLVDRKLLGWIPEPFIRVLNLSPATAYAKVYDGIATVMLYRQFVDFAVEYERTLKSPAKYEKIRAAIESERRVKAFLYLVPSYHLLAGLTEAFRSTKQLVLFGFVDEFKREQLNTRVRDANYRETTLHNALEKLVPAKTAS